MASATGIWCAAMRRRRASGSSGRSPRGDGRRSGSSCRKWSCADDDPHRNGQERSGARGVAGRLHEPRAQEIPMKRVGLFALLMTLPLALYAQAPRSLSLNDQRARDIFEQLNNLNTTVAASAMAKRLSDAGFPAADVQVIGLEGSKNGNLVARFRGTGREKPILLLAHLDVVEAKREDWSMDPFTFVEQDGYFYGRGTQDIKDGAAILVATLLRLKPEGYRPNRDLILELTTGEEGGSDYDG